jgi:hypothetical protein
MIGPHFLFGILVISFQGLGNKLIPPYPGQDTGEGVIVMHGSICLTHSVIIDNACSSRCA